MNRLGFSKVAGFLAAIMIVTTSAFVAGGISGAMGASPPVSDVRGEIDKYLSEWSATGRFNGSVLVAKDGKVVFTKGYGFSEVQKGKNNRPDTKFGIYSISKQFTTVLVFQLASEGKLRLDDPITKYLP